MNKEKFDALLPIILTSLIQKIIERTNISHDEAFLRLYNSNLQEKPHWIFFANTMFLSTSRHTTMFFMAAEGSL